LVIVIGMAEQEPEPIPFDAWGELDDPEVKARIAEMPGVLRDATLTLEGRWVQTDADIPVWESGQDWN
jgi:hypothetical protein